MSSQSHHPANPDIELALLNAEARRTDPDDLFDELRRRGVPPEIAQRLRELWGKTKVIAGQLVEVGKIVVAKLVEFLRQHPGLLIGAALGAALGLLSSQIPVIGGFLAPILAVVGAIYGAAIGHGIDSGRPNAPFLILAWDAARIFFAFLVDLFTTLTGQPA